MASREVFHFDEFALDVGERRLLRGTETVRLSPKAYDVLVVLVRQSGRLVTKDELLAHVWPESFVEEGILNVHVAALRKALGDDTRPPAYLAHGACRQCFARRQTRKRLQRRKRPPCAR